MNKRDRFENDRTAITVLLFALTVVTVGCILGISYMFEYGFYDKGDGGETAKSVAVQLYSLDDLEFAKDYYECSLENEDNYRTDYYETRFSPKSTNFVFVVTDIMGNALFTNLGSDEDAAVEAYKQYLNTKYKGTSNYYIYDEYGEFIPLQFNYFVAEEEAQQASDKYSNAFKWIEIANSMRFSLFAILAAAIVIILILLSIITINAGVKDSESGEIVTGFIDRLPLDLCAAFMLFVFWVAWLVIGLTSAADVDMVLNNVVIMITCVALMLFLMTFLSTLSVRIKVGKLFKNTVIYRVIRIFKRKAPRSLRRKLFGEMSMLSKLIIGIIVFVVIEAAIMISMVYFGIIQNPEDPGSVFLTFVITWAVTRLLLIPVFSMVAINLNYVKEEGQRLAQGVLGDGVSDKLTIAAIRAHGKNLDKIRQEINKAMEQELKSERLKSELITNVSHDIKTPLTSIKNYVDFLKSDTLTEEERAKYLDILTHHTEKLDLLLKNLIEASQINSGSIKINLEKTNLNILIEQTVEESMDRLEKSELLPRINMPEEDIFIMGDGQWLWRILANLMNNACKYATPGTDVNITLKKTDKKAIIRFANESREDLQVEGNELKERFMRGDGSRHSEGYGLGLSIANSLTDLQNGTMDISVVDGKFIVNLEFDLVK